MIKEREMVKGIERDRERRRQREKLGEDQTLIPRKRLRAGNENN